MSKFLLNFFLRGFFQTKEIDSFLPLDCSLLEERVRVLPFIYLYFHKLRGLRSVVVLFNYEGQGQKEVEEWEWKGIKVVSTCPSSSIWIQNNVFVFDRRVNIVSPTRPSIRGVLTTLVCHHNDELVLSQSS